MKLESQKFKTHIQSEYVNETHFEKNQNVQ